MTCCTYNPKYKLSIDLVDENGVPIHVDFTKIDMTAIMEKMKRRIR